MESMNCHVLYNVLTITPNQRQRKVDNARDFKLPMSNIAYACC